MSKQPAIPGHLIAVLVILGNYSYVSEYTLGMPMFVLGFALGGPQVGMALLLVLAPALFGWFLLLVCGLFWRHTWAPRASRITAAVLCAVGGVVSFLAAMDREAAALVWFLGGAAHLWLGLYVLWALGRGDVRTWLAGASAPA